MYIALEPQPNVAGATADLNARLELRQVEWQVRGYPKASTSALKSSRVRGPESLRENECLLYCH